MCRHVSLQQLLFAANATAYSAAAAAAAVATAAKFNAIWSAAAPRHSAGE